MTIWNALAAGGAAVMIGALSLSLNPSLSVALLAVLVFAICLWAAIP